MRARSGCCQRTSPTRARRSCNSVPGPAAPKRRCSRAASCACTAALPTSKGGRLTRSRPKRPRRAEEEEELEAVAAALPAAEHARAVGLLAKDVADERAAMLEIRAGTGGDEAALFAGDLLRMYSRYADT